MIYETGNKFTFPYIRYFITTIYPLYENGGFGGTPPKKKRKKKN